MFFQITVVAATLLCSLVAGFLFAFAIVAMPGIGKLDDRSFARAFQAMDRIIQDNNPLFIVVWVGSVVALVVSIALCFSHPIVVDRLILVAGGAVYLLGVQLPTAIINIPLNNRIQKLDVDAMDDDEIAVARGAFEGRWNRWNSIRAAFSLVAVAMLLVLVLRL